MPDQSRKRRPAPPKPKPASNAPPCEEGEKDAAAEKAFIESLIATGEAAKPNAKGKLPAGATHEIVESKDKDEPKVVRRRFSMY
jgi:hypothetical protein